MFHTIQIPISEATTTLVDSKLKLDFLTVEKFKLTINTVEELNKFVDEIAYWSQPVSIGDEGWRPAQQRQLNGVLISVLRTHMMRAA